MSMAVSAKAQENPASELLQIGGSLRLRQELKDDFDFAESAQDYMLTQLRLHATWELVSGISLFVQAQDARIFGESATAVPPIDQDAVPNVYADSFDLHQAYADLTLPLR